MENLMIFQSFYTLIFEKHLSSKKYTFLLISLILFILLVSFLLNRYDLTVNGNDLLRKYQINKIEKKEFQNVSTIIVGDSSAGNAIDAKYFSELSNLTTANLSLSGNWGVFGSLGIIKKAIAKNKNINNIIIIHTLDIWERQLPQKSILELYTLKETLQYLDMGTILSYFFNPKEISSNLKALFSSKNISENIDKDNDYVIQKKEKYSNDALHIKTNMSFNSLKINNDKLSELQALQSFCIENRLNCIVLKGPIHSTIAQNSHLYIKKIDELFKNKIHIPYIDNTFSYPKKCIGDSLDHIDIKCKKDVTNDYFQLLKSSLR